MPRPRSGPRRSAFDHRVPPRLDAIVRARHEFVDWLLPRCGDDEIRDELSVVLSELTANAVDAAPDGRDVRIRAWCEGDEVVLEVVNATSDPVPGPSRDAEDPLRPTGRGLTIARALVDDLSAHEDGAGHHVARGRRRLRSSP